MNELTTPQSALPTAPLAQGSHKEVRTPELIGAEIRMYVDAGQRVTMLCGIEIGRRLVEAKDLLKHGEWLPWLERETAFSDRQAQRYMKVFNEYGAAQLGLFGPETNATTLSHLPISKALALLSVPESEREAFAAEVGAEAISVKELERAIAEKKAAEELAKDAEERAKAAENALHELEESEGLAIAELEEKLSSLQEDAAKGREALREKDKLQSKLDAAGQTELTLREQIKELESRPVEVAVERDEKAIEEAVQQAKAAAAVEWAEKTKKLTDKLNKATAEAEKLKAKADKAAAGADEKLAAAEQETARIRQELEAARRQLKLADADVNAFMIYSKSLQQAMNEAITAFKRLSDKNPQMAARFVAPMRQILDSAEKEVTNIEETAAKAGTEG